MLSLLGSLTFHNVNVFQCYFLYFNTLLTRYTEVKYQFKQSFFHEYEIWRLLSEIGNVLLKRRVYLDHVSIIRFKSSALPIFMQRHVNHIDFIRYWWSVVCNYAFRLWKPRFMIFKRKTGPFVTVARKDFLVSEITRLNMLRIRLWKAREISCTKFLSYNLTRNRKKKMWKRQQMP